MILAVRVLLYIQLLLGLVRFFGPQMGFALNDRIWDLHIGIGVLIAILALIAFRPRTGTAGDGLTLAARYLPLIPLALGLLLLFDVFTAQALTIIHMLLGIGTIAVVETAAARHRRLSAIS